MKTITELVYNGSEESNTKIGWFNDDSHSEKSEYVESSLSIGI